MSENRTAVENMHQLFLEALRHREQEILRYIALLVPAVAGFVWLLQKGSFDDFGFAAGSCAVLLLLLLGAVYSLALGYNYRYITLELAKLEALLDMRDYVLQGWPRSRDEFLKRYKACCGIPWCTPPEVIKVFWWAFVVGIVGVTIVACAHRPAAVVLWMVIPCGLVSLAMGLAGPWHYGRKLVRRAKEEPEQWRVSNAGGPQ